MKKFLLMLTTLIIMVFAGVFLPADISKAEGDTEAPYIDLSTLKVDKKTVGLGEKVTISVKITDASEISMAGIYLGTPNVDVDANAWLWYNESTKLYEFTYTTKYFGLNDIQSIMAQDIYGNTVYVYNSKSHYFDWSSESNLKDLSAGDFTVNSGSYTYEEDAPVVDFDSIKVSNKNPKIGDEVIVSVKVLDASPIAAVRMSAADVSFSYPIQYDGVYNDVTGYYDIPMCIYFAAETVPIRIVAYDAWGNEHNYGFIDHEYYDTIFPDGITGDEDADMSKASVWVGGTKVDKVAPKLDLSSSTMTKKYLEIGENSTITIKVIDESDIALVDVWTVGVNPYTGAAGMAVYDPEKKTITMEVDGFTYGDYVIYAIRIKDIYGNTTYYQDSTSVFFTEMGYTLDPTAVDIDFSCFDYFVGLRDKDTDTFASNSTMDDTSSLKVGEMIQKGSKYDKLHKKGYNVKGFYEVNVVGTCNMENENTRVAFAAPEGFKNGDNVLITHLLKNGTVQVQKAIVKAGMVEIDVKEFSPFMIEVKASEDKGIVKVDGNTYSLTGKNTATFIAPKSKNVKKINIPAKIKKNGKTYSVTGIANAAFKKCKKLKSLTIKSTKLSSKYMGKTAFAGLSTKAKIVLPKKKVKTYKKLFAKCGMKVKKYKISGK